MKVLYATQATGNGHLARALELVPILQSVVEVDVMVSGTQSDLTLPFSVRSHKRGFTLHYQGSSGIDFWKTLSSMRPLRFFADAIQIPVKEYDLIVNDFEPISAWAGRWRGTPVIGMSHQAAFSSPNTPRPTKRDPIGELILKKFAPADKYVGFHFKAYGPSVYTPIIRQGIRQLKPEKGKHGVVYLPAIHPDALIKPLHQTDLPWHIFSRLVSQPVRKGRVTLFPIDQLHWQESFASASRVIMGAGFEGPSEAMFLGKPLMVVPINGQYEQICNAIALEKLGVSVVWNYAKEFQSKLSLWLAEEKAISMDYPDQIMDIIRQHILSVQPPRREEDPGKHPIQVATG